MLDKHRLKGELKTLATRALLMEKPDEDLFCNFLRECPSERRLYVFEKSRGTGNAYLYWTQAAVTLSAVCLAKSSNSARRLKSVESESGCRNHKKLTVHCFFFKEKSYTRQQKGIEEVIGQKRSREVGVGKQGLHLRNKIAFFETKGLVQRKTANPSLQIGRCN